MALGTRSASWAGVTTRCMQQGTPPQSDPPEGCAHTRKRPTSRPATHEQACFQPPAFLRHLLDVVVATARLVAMGVGVRVPLRFILLDHCHDAELCSLSKRDEPRSAPQVSSLEVMTLEGGSNRALNLKLQKLFCCKYTLSTFAITSYSVLSRLNR